MYENRREAAAACDYEGTAASHYSKIAMSTHAKANAARHGSWRTPPGSQPPAPCRHTMHCGSSRVKT